MTSRRIFFCLVLFCAAVTAQAQLAVTVSPPQIVGQKIVVKLTMRNNLPDKIESARAACFLSDKNSKVIGQSTKWVIGENGLEPKGKTMFNFVVSVRQAFPTTNLTAKVTFSRVILDSGPMVNVQQNVTVIMSAK
jgi:hypothetical protein